MTKHLNIWHTHLVDSPLLNWFHQPKFSRLFDDIFSRHPHHLGDSQLWQLLVLRLGNIQWDYDRWLCKRILKTFSLLSSWRITAQRPGDIVSLMDMFNYTSCEDLISVSDGSTYVSKKLVASRLSAILIKILSWNSIYKSSWQICLLIYADFWFVSGE